jgi:hypothetical protein
MKIPKDMQAKYDEVAPIIIDFCDKKLNDDYKGLCLHLLEKLCRERPSPLSGGRPHSWAAGIVYAIGQANFIFDKTRKINMAAAELASGFGISVNTARNKANELQEMFDVGFFNHKWLLPEMIENISAIWMIKLNGIIVDVRMMSLEIQQQAYEMGIIPYVPGERAATEKKQMRTIRNGYNRNKRRYANRSSPIRIRGSCFSGMYRTLNWYFRVMRLT